MTARGAYERLLWAVLNPYWQEPIRKAERWPPGWTLGNWAAAGERLRYADTQRGDCRLSCWADETMKISPSAFFGLVVVAFAPRTAFAEVSDKFPSTAEHWLIALAASIVVLLAARWRWWTVVPLAFLLVAVVWTDASLLSTDRDLGTALLQEQGWPHFYNLWASDLLMMTALVSGGVLGWRRSSRVKPPMPSLPREEI